MTAGHPQGDMSGNEGVKVEKESERERGSERESEGEK
jgi:hypothetical protein